MSFSKMTLSSPHESGRLGIAYLKRFWSYSMLQRSGRINDELALKESNYATALLNALGIGLEPTIQFLFQEAPSFESFEKWVSVNGHFSDDIIQLFNDLISGKKINPVFTKTENVLGEEDLINWKKNGYLIVRDAIPEEDCRACVKMIYDFLGAEEKDPGSWYRPHPAKNGIMVQLFNHPLLNKNGFADKIRRAYQQLWGRTDLMVSMDRVSFNPPETDHYHFPGPNLHWDVSVKTPIPFGLQGLLYLVDVHADQGAFCLVPGFHNKIESWLEALPEGAHPREQNFAELGVQPIVANAGDFIIWHQALPHGSSPNHAQKPRIVQYINYQPLDREIQTEWI
jgi:hypothetical protein